MVLGVPFELDPKERGPGVGVTWPSYPRIPHLAPGPGITRDDQILPVQARERLLGGRVRIEEKLDGANISISADYHGRLELASRGGAGAIDRGGHLGRARAWAAQHTGELVPLLRGGTVLYGEWLLTRHSISYDALPDLFVGFDLLGPDTGWIPIHERDERLHRAGLTTPPLIGEFDAADLQMIDAVMGPSQFGAPRMEGVILRTLQAGGEAPRLAKRLARGVAELGDEAFGAQRHENRLA